MMFDDCQMEEDRVKMVLEYPSSSEAESDLTSQSAFQGEKGNLDNLELYFAREYTNEYFSKGLVGNKAQEQCGSGLECGKRMEMVPYVTKVLGGAPSGCDSEMPVRLYIEDSFDLPAPPAQMHMLEQAKKMFNYVYLIAGITDPDTAFVSQEERMEILEHCKWVDNVVRGCQNNSSPQITKNFIKKHNIHYVVGYDRVPGFTWADD